MERQARDAMKELEKTVSELPLELNSYVYLDLWRGVQQLFCQQKYPLVCDICAAVCRYAS